jgi:hypothetical protein
VKTEPDARADCNEQQVEDETRIVDAAMMRARPALSNGRRIPAVTAALRPKQLVHTNAQTDEYCYADEPAQQAAHTGNTTPSSVRVK